VNALRQNRKAAVALIVGGDLIMLLLGWFLLIGPQRATAAEISRATAATESQIAEASRPIVDPTPAAVQQQPAIRTADLYSLAKAMPNDLDTPDLLLELNLLARESGVTLDSISPGEVASAGSYTTVPVALALSGDFYSLTDYLYRLRTLVGVRGGQLRTAGRLYSVGQLSLTGGTGSTSIQATLTVSAYVWGSVGATAGATPVTPAAPPADTSSTSTATTTTEATN
jgi:Tfp pilus assembly protein PilO